MRAWTGPSQSLLLALPLLAVLGGVAVLFMPRAAPVRFEPGMIIDYWYDPTPDSNGHRARFEVTEVAGGGYKVAHRIPDTGVEGTQTVTLADRVAGRCMTSPMVSGDNSAPGCFSPARVSDALYYDFTHPRAAEFRRSGRASSGPLYRMATKRPGVVYHDDRPVRVGITGGVTKAHDDGLLINDDPQAPFAQEGNLINVWTEGGLAKVIEEDLDRRGRASTTAILFLADGTIDRPSQTLLAGVARWTGARPGRSLAMVVHTSGRGEPAAAWQALSDRRAQALAKAMAAYLPADRFTAEGVGASRPSKEAVTRQERVEFIAGRAKAS